MKQFDTRIRQKIDTTANWNMARGMVPLDGEIIIYKDYKTVTKEVNGESKIINIPGIKIGDGRAYVQDLPFIDDELRDDLLDHINNTDIHTTPAEKMAWWNKLNVNDYSEVVDGALVFNRN